MYCGGKRYSPSSSEASIINRVFHVSWFPNKSKPKSSHPHRTKSSQTQPRSQPARPSPNSHSPPFQKEPRFYSLDDDDAYWRLSFREQKTEDRKSITGITHLSSDSDHDKFQIPVSGITSSGFGNSSNSMHQNVSLRNSSLSSSPEEDYAFGRRVRYDGTESRRKSPRRKIKQKKRGNNYSPKGEFRVRVLEDMKKEKTMRSEKKEMIKVGPVGGTTIYDSFAEVKNSFDPQQDFRDSMVEMICEKGIRRAEELEDLLACYLNLNCDEHHYLIIKVFQQVLLELSQQRCGALIRVQVGESHPQSAN